MTLPLIPDRSTDEQTWRKRVAERINNILKFEHDESRARTREEALAGVTPTNPAYPPIDLRRYGAALDAVASDSMPLSQAILVAQQFNSAVITVTGPARLSENVTIPSTVIVKFVDGGKFVVDSGDTVTFEGVVDAGVTHIFDGSGVVSFSGSQNKTFRPEWWGAVADSTTDDFNALESVNIAASAAQGEILLSAGGYKFIGDLDLRPNVTWRGPAKAFAAAIIPSGNSSLRMVGSGVPGGIAFRNTLVDLTVDARTCEATQAIWIETAYDITLQRVFLYEFNTDSGNTRGIYVADCNNYLLDNVGVYGTNNSAGHGIVIDSGAYGRMISPDVEVCNRGIFITGTGQCDVISPYLERNISAIYINGSGGTNIYGGKIQNPSASGVAINIQSGAGNLGIYNPKIELTGGSGIDSSAVSSRAGNMRVYGCALGDINDPNNALEKYNGTGVSGYWADAFFNKKNQADNTATAHFTVTLSTDTAVACDLVAWSFTGGGIAKNVTRKQFMISCPSGTAVGSTVQAVGTDVDESSSGNYDQALSVTLSPSTNTCEIRVTANPAGALDNGTATDVYTELRIRSSSQSNTVARN